MDISSIFHAVLDAKSDTAADSVAALRIGDQLKGLVLRFEQDGRALIDLGRFRVRAMIDFQTQVGQTIKLTVVQNGTPLKLQLDVSSTPKIGSRTPRIDFLQALPATDQKRLAQLLDHLAGLPKSAWAAVPSSRNIVVAMTMIKSLFDAIPVERPAAELGQWLQSALENRGILFEKKMADAIVPNPGASKEAHHPGTSQIHSLIGQDLKPQLLVFKSFLDHSGDIQKLPIRLVADDVAFLRKSVNHLLDHMLQQQERVSVNLRDGDTFQIFSHVLAFKDQEQPVQFKVYYPQKNKRAKDGSHQHVALLLKMDRLGPVRVDFGMVGRHLSIRIFVRSKDICQQIEKQTDALAHKLKGLFDEVSMVTRVSEEKIRQFEQPSQDISPMGRIDIKV